MNVRLTFVNRLSALAGADQIVLQDDLGVHLGDADRARKVIRNCGSRHGHPFFYVNDCEIALSGDWASQSPSGSARTELRIAEASTVWPGRSWKAKS